MTTPAESKSGRTSGPWTEVADDQWERRWSDKIAGCVWWRSPASRFVDPWSDRWVGRVWAPTGSRAESCYSDGYPTAAAAMAWADGELRRWEANPREAGALPDVAGLPTCLDDDDDTTAGNAAYKEAWAALLRRRRDCQDAPIDASGGGPQDAQVE